MGGIAPASLEVHVTTVARQVGVEVVALSRHFKGASDAPVVALDNFDLCVAPGQIHGLLGPNGAGKTTLSKILSTVLLPTSGRVLVGGHDVVKDVATVRPLVGVVFGGDRGLYGRLTARETLRFWCAMYRFSRGASSTRVQALLDRTGLTHVADRRVETFSRGMKQRLHLARGLVGDPRLVILDEPTAGMDPVAALAFRELVNDLRTEGRTVLLATHDMAEAESVCDRVSLIDNGRLLTTERPTTLRRWLSEFERVDVVGAGDEVLAAIAELPGVSSVTRGDRPGTARIATAAQGVAAQVLRLLGDAGVSTVRSEPPSLEEVYLHHIGHRGLEVS